MAAFDPPPTQRAVAPRVATVNLHPPQLVVQFPDGRRQEYALPPGPLRVGRDEHGNQIVIPSTFTSISRLHLELRRERDDFQVVDLESGNGVLLNGQRIQGSAPLRDGDEICIGLASMGQEVRLSFRAGNLPQSISEATRVPAPASGLALPPRGDDQPRLHIRWPDGQEVWATLQKDVVLIGRDPQADVRLPASFSFVVGRHAEIRRTLGVYQIVDLGSSYGTRLNGQALPPGRPFKLRDGAVIRLGDDQLGVSVGLTFHEAVQSAPALGFVAADAPARPIQQDIVTLGRGAGNDVVLDKPSVSRQHARLLREGAHFWLEDLRSAYGTFVNGQRIKRAELQPGDLVQIEAYLFIFQHGALRQYDSQGMRVDVVDLHEDVRTRQGPLRILDGIDLTVLPREFVGLVGASGAGKSTLLEALVGIRPAQGQVLLNGRSLYREIHRLRAELGYVPQADILHTALTVEHALDYSAQLRLPPDTTPAERQKRIAAVLDTVGLNSDVIRRTRIGQLSGGQRKRVSIAAELLADPKLFLLDEPTSGLDPGLEKKMMHTLRQMADEGRTIILITHATANLIQVDHVAFLAQGRLVYFGPPAAALPFFEVDEFADTYDRLTGHGAEWRQVFVEKKPEAYQRYVVARHATRAVVPVAAGPRRSSGSSPARMLRQLSVLTRRAISLLSSDLVTLCLLLMLFPLTATLQLMVGSADVLTGDPAIVADPAAAAQTRTESYVPLPQTNTFVFVMGLEAVLIGMYVPSNELIKERSIYLRERLVNLQVPAYLLSKVVVFMTFAALQTILYLMLLSLRVHLPARGLLLPGPVELFITLFLTLTAGIGLGLLVSAISRSADMAIYALVIMMFFQFFFSGTVFDLRGNPAQFLSYLTTTRWSLTAIGVTIDMPRLAASTIVCAKVPVNPLQPSAGETTHCINQRDAVNDLLLPYGHEKLLQSWGVLAGTALLTLLATGVMIKRLDPTS